MNLRLVDKTALFASGTLYTQFTRGLVVAP
jgi:hypothetical protein